MAEVGLNTDSALARPASGLSNRISLLFTKCTQLSRVQKSSTQPYTICGYGYPWHNMSGLANKATPKGVLVGGT